MVIQTSSFRFRRPGASQPAVRGLTFAHYRECLRGNVSQLVGLGPHHTERHRERRGGPKTICVTRTRASGARPSATACLSLNFSVSRASSFAVKTTIFANDESGRSGSAPTPCLTESRQYDVHKKYVTRAAMYH
jgi:hypothetical protein